MNNQPYVHLNMDFDLFGIRMYQVDTSAPIRTFADLPEFISEVTDTKTGKKLNGAFKLDFSNIQENLDIAFVCYKVSEHINDLLTKNHYRVVQMDENNPRRAFVQGPIDHGFSALQEVIHLIGTHNHHGRFNECGVIRMGSAGHVDMLSFEIAYRISITFHESCSSINRNPPWSINRGAPRFIFKANFTGKEMVGEIDTNYRVCIMTRYDFKTHKDDLINEITQAFNTCYPFLEGMLTDIEVV
jgi:hypothetical protein